MHVTRHSRRDGLTPGRRRIFDVPLQVAPYVFTPVLDGALDTQGIILGSPPVLLLCLLLSLSLCC